jgi:hypothetical protein
MNKITYPFMVILLLVLLTLTYKPSSSLCKLDDISIEESIIISSEFPLNDTKWAYLNPDLSITVKDRNSNLFDVMIKSNSSGSWKIIETFLNVSNGTYITTGKNMLERSNTTYFWSVNVSDINANWINKTYTFEMVNYTGRKTTHITDSVCSRYGYVQPDIIRGRWRLTSQNGTFNGNHPGQYAVYDINLGWTTTFGEIFNSTACFTCAHIVWGYCNNRYWIIEGSHAGNPMYEINRTNWSDFKELNWSTIKTEIVNPTAPDTEPVPYAFNDSHMWLLFAEQNASNIWFCAYVPWRSSTGWGDINLIYETAEKSQIVGVSLLRLNRTHWIIYYGNRTSREMSYVESFDAGQTWSYPDNSTGIIHIRQSGSQRLSIARYGRSRYYLFFDSSHALIYESKDAYNWSLYDWYPAGDNIHHGCLINPNCIISTYAQAPDPGPQYASFTDIPIMNSNPNKCDTPYPPHNTNLSKGTNSTSLTAIVHGNQTYDISFYWENGTFIGKDILLEEGDIAHISVDSLSDGGRYGWYTISRGTAVDRWRPNEPLTTADEKKSDIFYFNITNSTNTNKTVSDLSCEGNLNWNNVKAGSTVNSSFTVENIGDNESLLDWDIIKKPGWGKWIFTPNCGFNLEYGSPIIINVTVIAPEEKKGYSGKIHIENIENKNDSCTIDVHMCVSKNKSFTLNQLILRFLIKRPFLFSILRQIIGI